MSARKTIAHYIDGRKIINESAPQFTNVNPATAETIGQVCEAREGEIREAIETSKRGFLSWSRMTGAQRGRILNKASHILRQRNAELARIEVEDTGKPISEAQTVDIKSAADCLEYFGGLAATLEGRHYDLGESFAYSRREPFGIVAGLGAWNYPIQIAAWKSAPALACGNAMIFKPSELTPQSAVILGEIYTEAGLPDGAFNVVQGPASTGQQLTNHPDIAKISLTGEVETGRKVMADAAQSLKKVTMELGGKSPLIIFGDADIKNAVSGALLANFYTQGEICSNAPRVFLQRPMKEKFLVELLPRVEAMIVGDPLDPKTHVGALISREHFEKVLAYIQIGKKEGAKLLCGGGPPPSLKNTPFEKGNFVAPTVFDGCHDEMRIVKEEIFGPVMSILEFDNEDEVIKRANQTRFGLAGGVFTRDIQRAHRVVKNLEAGICWINTYNQTPIEIPFGGTKQSGMGRENSQAAIESYSQIKSVYVEMGNVDSPY